MKKNKFVLVALVAVIISACTPCMDALEYEIDNESKRIASSEVCTESVAFAGIIPPDIAEALRLRFTNISYGVMTNTRIVVIHTDCIDLVPISSIKGVYEDGGIIVVLDPDHAALSLWAEEHGFNHTLCAPAQNSDLVSHEIYAFNKSNKHYILDIIPEDIEQNEFLNAFISWINENLSPPPPFQNTDPQDVRKLFAYQTIEHTFNVALKKEEAHVALSSADVIDMRGTITVKIIVYPLYAFEDQPGQGDYYIVSQTVIARNDNMYKGRWTNKHGGVSVRLCGYYMTNLGVMTTILNGDGSAVSNAIFAYGGNPSPSTTINTTSYTKGISWNLQATVSGDGATFGGGVTFNNSTTTTIADMEIRNNSGVNGVSYTYPFHNLPKYNPNISITDPPAVAVSNADFQQDWIWRIPDTKDYGGGQFVLRTSIAPQYGSCHFISTGADFKSHTWDDAVQGASYFLYKLTPPNRIPTGELNIFNSMSGQYFSDVRIWKSTTPTTSNPDYVISGSFAPNQTAAKTLPVGTYKIQFKAGPDAASSTFYHLETPVTIVRAEVKNLNSGYDFIIGGY